MSFVLEPRCEVIARMHYVLSKLKKKYGAAAHGVFWKTCPEANVSNAKSSDNRDFKIVDNGRLRRLDAYTGDLGRAR